jgi:hypothetical protein
VQISAQATPLLLASRDQPLPGVLQIRGEPDCVHGHLNLAGQVFKQAHICRGEDLSWCAGSHYQMPYGLPLVDQRQDKGLSLQGAVLCARRKLPVLRASARQSTGLLRASLPSPWSR